MMGERGKAMKPKFEVVMGTVFILILLVAFGCAAWGAGDSSVGIVLGQGPETGQAAWGVEFLVAHGTQCHGLAVWSSGKPFQGENVIDTSIPHGDYHIREEHGSIGFQYLHASGSPRALAILGVGFVADETRYIQVSNVTGWEWSGGSDTRYKPTAQAGARLQLGPKVSLRVGYDSKYRAFGGLAFNIAK